MEIIDPPLGKKPASKKKIAVRNKSTNLIKNTYVEVFIHENSVYPFSGKNKKA